jgi:hypothetical protein
VGVARVDDDVARVEVRRDLFDDLVHGPARLDHDEDPAWAFEGGDELFHRVGGEQAPSCPWSATRRSLRFGV